MVLCTPDWGTTGEHAYWRRLLYCITLGQKQLPDGPSYVPEDSHETMCAPEWGTFLSVVPVSETDQVVLKKLMAENQDLTFLNLKKISEYSSVSTTSGERSDEQQTPLVSSPLAEADDHLSDMASAIRPLDTEVLAGYRWPYRSGTWC